MKVVIHKQREADGSITSTESALLGTQQAAAVFFGVAVAKASPVTRFVLTDGRPKVKVIGWSVHPRDRH